MNATSRSTGRIVWVAVRSMILLTILLGVVYMLAITAVGQLALPWQANGSIVKDSAGHVVGSALIGQPFSDSDGAPLTQYFQPRPSAAGDGYDGKASSGSNLGPENPDLIKSIKERKAQVARFNGVPESDVPADAVTASSSGLDPHISPAYAEIQITRVADARGLPVAQVRELVRQYEQGRDLGYLGEPTVNVLRLNTALDEMKG